MTTTLIRTPDQLGPIAERVQAERDLYRLHVMLCGGTGCHASNSLALKAALLAEIDRRGLSDEINVIETGCNGFCAMGPVMTVFPDGVFYQKIQTTDVEDIVQLHFIDGVYVQRLLYSNPNTGETIPLLHDIPFFANQTLWALRNKGLIDPERIDEYIWRDGYKAAAQALLDMTPSEILGEVKESGLRGRGGGGFPTGLKWEFCSASKGDVKYVLCNADEGDPGAFMDRSVMEADPHAVLEGMIIAARAVGAHQGYIYCRAEYPLAVRRLGIAIEQAREHGLLGKNIFGSGFDFDLEIYQGAGAFVCGEETALMTSIEGNRGMPRPRPPFPAVSGLWQKPTVLNNVETYANVPQIILKGGEVYAAMGTESSKGTKVFALTGKLNNIGLVEVPMGTPLGKIIFDIGGGIPGDGKFKAVQLGGPSGGCIPAEQLNIPTDYEEIVKAGAIMGSGGMIVMDNDNCMVDMARFFMDFCHDESCGKCTACRVGTKRMLEVLQRICRGEGEEGDIELLEDLAADIKDSALCGLGQTAPNPVLSTIRYFRDEYEAHIHDKHCPAVVCSDLFESPCQHACPVGMEIPKYIALIRAGRLDDAYKVLLRTNPFPSVCGRVCGHVCQLKCRRGQLDAPLAIMHLKRFVTDRGKRPEPISISAARAQKIAVVGAGPSGMTAALELRKRGYPVTVFEELPEAGGMLRYGIPAYRLPRDVLASEIQWIVDTGVELRTNKRVGRDVTFEALDQEYDAIYLAVGAHKSYPLGVPGDDAENVIGAVEMLRRFNMGEEFALRGKVAVIGGGNSAIDAARTATRLGADSVTIYYRRERKDMPAQEWEIEAAEQEGVKVEYLVAPTEVIVDKGHATGLRLSRMQLAQFDRSGRKVPMPIPGVELRVEADVIISAVSQGADLSFLSGSGSVKTGRTRISVDHAMRTSNPKVWAGGDAVTGPMMVVDAIRAGRDAATAIDAAIRETAGEPAWVPPEEEPIDIPFEVDEETTEQDQVPMPEAPADLRSHDFREVELGYTLGMAIDEARRCMRCDAAKA